MESRTNKSEQLFSFLFVALFIRVHPFVSWALVWHRSIVINLDKIKAFNSQLAL